MNDNPISTPVTRYLDSMKIPYRVFTHPGEVRSLEQAALERDQRPEQVVRSILFRLNENEFVMVLVAGPKQVSWHRLRGHLQVSRMTMAAPDEVLDQTNFPTGAVSPFGLPQKMRILVDRSVLLEEEISIGSGIRNSTVILHTADLQRALGQVEVGAFTQAG